MNHIKQTRRQNLKTLVASPALAFLPAAFSSGSTEVRENDDAGGTPRKSRKWQNWAGNQMCMPSNIIVPADSDELSKVLKKNANNSIRCVGAGHSFSPLVPTDGVLISLDRFSGADADLQNSSALIQAGTKLANVSRILDKQNFSLKNLPDVDVQSFAGAISTGTHGTGKELSALHAEISELELLTAGGERFLCSNFENSEIFQAAKVSLGCLGIITQMRVNVIPAYNLHRRVWFEKTASLLERADELAKKHRNFEAFFLPFTGFALVVVHDIDTSEQELLANENDDDGLQDLRKLRDWLGFSPMLRKKVASLLIDENVVTESKNRAWKLLATNRPFKFTESEYHVPVKNGIACVKEIIEEIEEFNQAYFPIEFRYVASDNAWLSPFYEQDSCSIAIHSASDEDNSYLINDLGPIFKKYKGRPHWGKLNDLTARDFEKIYPKFNDFRKVRQELDSKALFANSYIKRAFDIKI